MRLLLISLLGAFAANLYSDVYTVSSRSASVILEGDEPPAEIVVDGFYVPGKDPYLIAREFLAQIEKALEHRVSADQKQLLLQHWAKQESALSDGGASNEAQAFDKIYQACEEMLQYGQLSVDKFWISQGIPRSKDDPRKIEWQTTLTSSPPLDAWRTVTIPQAFRKSEMQRLKRYMLRGARILIETADDARAAYTKTLESE